jgi:hypothetical protein
MRRLFEPNTRAVGHPPGPTMCDAVPDSLVDGTPSELRAALPSRYDFSSRQCRLTQIWPAAWPGSRKRSRCDRWRGDRKQRRWHAMRLEARCVSHRHGDDVRASFGNDHQHRGAGRRGTVCATRTGARAPAAALPETAACYTRSLSCPRPERQRPCSTLGPRTPIFQQTEPAKWDFCTRQDGLTNRLSSCSRNQLARNCHRDWTRLNNRDIEAANPVMN